MKGLNRPLGKSIALTAVAAAISGWLLSSGPPPASGEAGLTLALPARVGTWTGSPGQPSEAEKRILPPDTEIAKMQYHRPIPGTSWRSEIQATIVLSGKDRTSIHRPEVCLAGQGWNVDESVMRTVSLKNGGEIQVNSLRVSREMNVTGGESREIRAHYVYWFVGSRTTTPDNLQRILSTARDNVLRGENPRWAYVSLMAIVTGDLVPEGSSSDATLAEIDAWIEGAVPDFQVAFQPAGWW